MNYMCPGKRVPRRSCGDLCFAESSGRDSRRSFGILEVDRSEVSKISAFGILNG